MALTRSIFNINGPSFYTSIRVHKKFGFLTKNISGQTKLLVVMFSICALSDLSWLYSSNLRVSRCFCCLKIKLIISRPLKNSQVKCPSVCVQVRRELYSQCFDELIRQSTINCVERGLLLLRVTVAVAHNNFRFIFSSICIQMHRHCAAIST